MQNKQIFFRILFAIFMVRVARVLLYTRGQMYEVILNGTDFLKDILVYFLCGGSTYAPL